MKSNNEQNDCSSSFNLNKRLRECEDMMTQYWNENPDLLKVVEDKKETKKVIAGLWEGYLKQSAPLLFPKVDKPLPKEAKPSLTERTLSGLDRLGQLKQSPLLQLL